ncbi:MAG: hypothetical protein R2764_22915 [Bacteroidales bacterium]
MNKQEVIHWLLEGDVSIQYQVWRDLHSIEHKELQSRIGKEGWGAHYLSKRKPDGHWGLQFYQPKWISTHYTLLDLRNLFLPPDNEMVKESLEFILKTSKAEDGGIQLGPSTSHRSDVCVNGMFLNYASYFQTEEHKLCSIIDSILGEIMPDGGFNCRTTRSGAKHSSLHTTISVLEGFEAYLQSNYNYRRDEVNKAKMTSLDFLLQHQVFLSDKTGKIIDPAFLRLTFPSRWRYDILRALDYFRYAGVVWDERMHPAIEVLLKKRNKDLTWNLQARHLGQVHFEMEKAGKPSRWNTLRALRVLKHFKMD